MFDNVPDNYDLFEQYEAEQDRQERRMRQEEIDWEGSDWGCDNEW